MIEFRPKDKDYAERVRASFARQGFMAYLGADVARIAPGACDIVLPYRPELSQQHRYFHGGVIATLADNAGGYASYTLMGAGDSVLTVEFKLNILTPAAGEALLARGRVIKAGRTLSVCRADVFAVAAGVETLCASAQLTIMCMSGRADRPAAATG